MKMEMNQFRAESAIEDLEVVTRKLKGLMQVEQAVKYQEMELRIETQKILFEMFADLLQELETASNELSKGLESLKKSLSID